MVINWWVGIYGENNKSVLRLQQATLSSSKWALEKETVGFILRQSFARWLGKKKNRGKALIGVGRKSKATRQNGKKGKKKNTVKKWG